MEGHLAFQKPIPIGLLLSGWRRRTPGELADPGSSLKMATIKWN